MLNFLKKLFTKKYYTGALESPVDTRNINLASFLETVKIPSEYYVDLGEVDDQGEKSCCVGCAITKVIENKMGVNLSYDDLYNQCKAIDGIPTILGTYPSVGAHIAHKKGIATLEAFNSGSFVEIEASRLKNKVQGYAFVEEDFDLICQAIYQKGPITASFKVDTNWFKGIIGEVVKSVGGHYVALCGYNEIEQKLYIRNSWGIKWIGYVYGIFNKKVKPGEAQMYWDDYKNNIRDIIAFTYIPPEIKEEATKYDYRFMTTLKIGSNGYEVKKLQERLGILADGSFGKKTQRAVMDFQTKNNLDPDGVAGPRVRKILNINTKSLIPLWALAIQKHEGYYTGSRSYRNCNPGNFKYTKLTETLGATGKDKDGFCIFPDYEKGFSALKFFLEMACKDQLGYYKSTMTIYEFFKIYAPSFENDTMNYAKTVAKAVGATVDTKINELL